LNGWSNSTFNVDRNVFFIRKHCSECKKGEGGKEGLPLTHISRGLPFSFSRTKGREAFVMGVAAELTRKGEKKGGSAIAT